MDPKTITDLSTAKLAQPDTQAAGDRLTPAPASTAESKDFSGTVLGNYRLVRKIAEGGMGVVYEAIQLNLSRKVALKILNEELASRSEFLQRFQREAKAAAALNHPNVVHVHDFNETQGWSYLIMEYVDGQDLSDFVEEHGKLSVAVALDIIDQAAQALKAACEKAIIHRDIKPSNLMLTRDGRVKISDLGLAKILTEASDLTLSGIGMGSPYFMAPEQANDARDVDHRADVYALGLTLLFLLTGKRPFDGNTPFSIVLAHANKPLPRGLDLGTDLPAEVEALVQRMAAKDPAARYANYDLLIADVRRVKAGYAPALQLPRARQNISLGKLAWPAAAVLFAGLAVAVFFGTRAHNRAGMEQASRRPDQMPATFIERDPPRRLRGPIDGPEDPGIEERPGPDLRRGSEPRVPLPFGRLPRPSFAPLEDAPVAAMLSQADDYAAKHPQDFRDMIDRYRQVLTKARGSDQQETVERKMDDVIARHQETIKKVIHDFELKMEEKLKAGKPQEAYDVWRDFPSNLRTRDSDLQIEQLLDRSLPASFTSR